MKTIYIICFLLVNTLAFSQARISIPYGMNEISPGVYVDDTEISVLEWLEFYYHSSRDVHPTANLRYRPLFPEVDQPVYAFLFDVSQHPLNEQVFWKTTTSFGLIILPMPKDSISSKKELSQFVEKYLELPISYISYQQAIEYCAWRTNKTREKHFVSVEFSLPSRQELASFNDNMDSLSVDKTQVVPTGNYRNIFYPTNSKKANYYRTCGKSPLPVASFSANKKDLYDIQGNLAEMTSEEGVAVGGSYLHPYKDSLQEKTLRYSKPEVWLGLRCIAKKTKG